MLYKSPDPLPFAFQRQSVFIAGGISNCPDWQNEMSAMLDTSLYDVVNPRRAGGFDRTGVTAEEQITWEHRALSLIDACIFWFPCETLCPITLLELGKMLHRAQHHNVMLAIGWHPDYQRAFDLEVQIRLENPESKYLLHAAPGWLELCAVVKKQWG
jgi:hypothetical protein